MLVDNKSKCAAIIILFFKQSKIKTSHWKELMNILNEYNTEYNEYNTCINLHC